MLTGLTYVLTLTNYCFWNHPQDYTELLDGQKDIGGNRDILTHKLKLRIQERDRALEVTTGINMQFLC